MLERRKLLFAGGGIVLVLLAALVVIGPGDFFLPEQSTQVEDTPVGEEGEVLKRGTFVGADGHDVSGTVELIRTGDGLALQFRNYSQQQGPDVFIYVTPAETPDTDSEIGAGTKVRIDGGADNGESTKEGTFVQPLPDGVEAGDVNGVGAWCDRFSVPFGYASLNASA